MAVLRKLARPLLAAPFVTGGLHALRHPDAAAVDSVRPVVQAVGARFPALDGDPRHLLRATGAVQAGAALLLATGRAPRLAALTLAATLVPTSLAAHAHRTLEDPDERARQRARLLTDLSALGGLLIAAADTHGKPSFAHRSRHALRRSAKAAAKHTARTAETTTHFLKQPS
ncbi:DoxX family protein [Streptomyces sp. NPDC051815]|uniref:DoxX family protein n=1 Tax=Streptomyces sp. NPDC051815 TaxID=3365674 RepID=UPI003787805F